MHVLGVSSLAAGHKTLIPQVIEELKKLGREDIVVIGRWCNSPQDYDFLYKAGVAAIFGPGTSVAKAACQILKFFSTNNPFSGRYSLETGWISKRDLPGYLLS